MSATGRLWRRAPAWRFVLLSAIALTGLAVMFPPALPTLHWPIRPAHPGSSGTATFHPKTEAAPSEHGVLDLPPPGQPRSGLIDFAGRRLPLTAGAWQTLAVTSAPVGVQELLLDRIANDHLKALMLTTATGVFGGPSGPVGVPPQCADPERLAGAIVPEQPGQSPLQHECWSIVPVDMKALAGGEGSQAVIAGLNRLGSEGVAVSDRMLAVQFVRSDDHGWQLTTVMVPAKGGPTTALSAWATRYQALLHKAFDNTAHPADLTPAAIDVP